MSDRYRGPSDLPPVVPVFPLSGAILLPRAVLPLNVFEPRYLAMVEDAVNGARIIGIVQPAASEAGVEGPRSPAALLRQIGCAGRITMYQEIDDGRRVIALTGIARFEIGEEAPSNKPYRQVAVCYDRFAADFMAGSGEEEVDRAKLIRVLRSYLDANRLTADWGAIDRAPSEFLVNALAVMSPFSAEEKQALLEARDLKARADALVALAEMELAAGRRSPGMLQ